MQVAALPNARSFSEGLLSGSLSPEKSSSQKFASLGDLLIYSTFLFCSPSRKFYAFQRSIHSLAISSIFCSVRSRMFFTVDNLDYIAPSGSAMAVHWFFRLHSYAIHETSPLSWPVHLAARQRLADETEKRNVDFLRINSAAYRQRLKNDNDALTTNAEKEMLAAAAER